MANIYDMSDTWNDGATTFTSIKMNVTDTASASDSLLMDLQVDGTSKFKVDKDGSIVVPTNSFITNSSDASKDGLQITDGGIDIIRNSAAWVSMNQPAYAGIRLRDSVSLQWTSGTTATSGTTDLILARDAANTLAQRNSTNAQTFNIYNIYNDAENYERGFVKWQGNEFQIGAEVLGTGIKRNVKIVGPGGAGAHYISLNEVGGNDIKLNAGSGRSISLAYVGSNGISFNSTGFNPSSSNIFPLGKNTNKWSNLFLADTAYIDQKIEMAPTWNDALTTFAGLSMNVTDTASASDSLLMDLQVGGTSKFKVDKSGFVYSDGIRGGVLNTNDGINVISGGIDVLRNNGTVVRINGESGGYIGLANQMEIMWTSSSSASGSAGIYDLVIGRDDADTFAQRRSTNPQTFNIYNTYTDASNYERGFMRWNADVFEIGTEHQNGTARTAIFYGKLQATASGQILVQAEDDTYINYPTPNKIGFIANGSNVLSVNAGGLDFNSGTQLKWTNGSYIGSPDTGLARDSAGVVKVTDGSTGIGDLIYGSATSTPTWNDALTTFTGLSMNVTDTASDAASLLMDLQVGGVSKFSVEKNGIINAGNFTAGVGSGGAVSDLITSTSQLRFYASSTSYMGRMQADGWIIRGSGFLGWFSNDSNSNNTYDVRIYRDDANKLALRNSTNAQTFNIYNTYTDADNYERGFMRWNANVFEIGTEAGTTGTIREMLINSTNKLTLQSGGGAQLILDEAGAYDSATLRATSTVILSAQSGGNAVNVQLTGNASLGHFSCLTGQAGLGGWGANTGTNGWQFLTFKGRTVDPNDPAEGNSTIWQSDGTATGDAGDILMKITSGGVTKTATLLDFSAYTPGEFNLTPTWNDANTTFTGIGLDVTDTASDAASLLMDLKVGSASKFSVSKLGNLYIGSPVVKMASWLDLYIYNSSQPFFRFQNGSMRIANGSGGPSIDFCSGWASSAGDLSLTRDAANTLAQRNSTNAQTFNIYNTYTDASNYERGFMRWNANVLEIGTEAAGAGSARDIRMTRRVFFSQNAEFESFVYNKRASVIGVWAQFGGDNNYIGTENAHNFSLRTHNLNRLTLDTVGSMRLQTALTVATLPGTPAEGMIARVTDGDSGLTHGQTVVNSGAGATPYLVWYNGTNWTILGS